MVAYDTEKHASASSTDIGAEAAESAALGHAGLSESQVAGLRSERDYDDGRWEYELEFHTDTAAYEVTVDAISGSVLDYEKENLRSSSTSDIGAQAAKSAALWLYSNGEGEDALTETLGGHHPLEHGVGCNGAGGHAGGAGGYRHFARHRAGRRNCRRPDRQ